MAKAFTYPKTRTESIGYRETGVVWFDVSVEVSTAVLATNNNIINICKFPRGVEMVDPAGWLVSVDDLDGATGLVWDLQLNAEEDGSGTTTTTLISGSTVGRTAGTDALDAATAAATYTALTVDDSETWLQVKFTTKPTTAAAGTIRVIGAYVHSGDAFVHSDTGLLDSTTI